MVRLTEDEIT